MTRIYDPDYTHPVDDILVHRHYRSTDQLIFDSKVNEIYYFIRHYPRHEDSVVVLQMSHLKGILSSSRR